GRRHESLRSVGPGRPNANDRRNPMRKRELFFAVASLIAIGTVGTGTVGGGAMADSAVQVIGPGVSHHMPPGETARAPSGVVREAARPRGRRRGGELQAIKGRSVPAEPSQPVPERNAPRPEAVLTNCQTNDSTGPLPPDIHGAVGATNLVVVTNVDIGIYN